MQNVIVLGLELAIGAMVKFDPFVLFFRHELYIEMACNGTEGAGAGFTIAPPDPNRTYTLSTAEIAVMDRKVYELLRDFDVIIGLAKVRSDSKQSYLTITVSFCLASAMPSFHGTMEFCGGFYQNI